MPRGTKPHRIQRAESHAGREGGLSDIRARSRRAEGLRLHSGRDSAMKSQRVQYHSISSWCERNVVSFSSVVRRRPVKPRHVPTGRRARDLS